MTLMLKNGRPAFPKPDKKLAKLAERRRQLLAAHESSLVVSARKLMGLDGPRNSEPVTPEYENIINALFEETTGRLEALLDHYKINGKGRMTPLLLAVALANDFVPNFDVFISPPRSGRPRSRSDLFGPSFKLAVEAVAKRRGKGIADACLQLSRKQPWDVFKASTLETRYHEETRKSGQMENALRNYRGLLAEGLPKPGE